MDIPGVHDDWEQQVTPLLQDMSNCAASNTSNAASIIADHHHHHDDYTFNPTEVSPCFYYILHLTLENTKLINSYPRLHLYYSLQEYLSTREIHRESVMFYTRFQSNPSLILFILSSLIRDVPLVCLFVVTRIKGHHQPILLSLNS